MVRVLEIKTLMPILILLLILIVTKVNLSGKLWERAWQAKNGNVGATAPEALMSMSTQVRATCGSRGALGTVPGSLKRVFQG